MDVSEIVDKLILREDLPVRAGLKPIRAFDGLYPEGEEAEAYWDFIRWYLCREHAVLMAVPVRDKGRFFLPIESDDSLSFPFSSADFRRQSKGFNFEHWRMRKVLERVDDLAILYSVLSDGEAKKRVRRRVIGIIKDEFRGDSWKCARAVDVWNRRVQEE